MNAPIKQMGRTLTMSNEFAMSNYLIDIRARAHSTHSEKCVYKAFTLTSFCVLTRLLTEGIFLQAVHSPLADSPYQTWLS